MRNEEARGVYEGLDRENPLVDFRDETVRAAAFTRWRRLLYKPDVITLLLSRQSYLSPIRLLRKLNGRQNEAEG